MEATCYTQVLRMLLRMSSSMNRSQSNIFHFRQRIPKDVLPKAMGLKLIIKVGDRTIS